MSRVTLSASQAEPIYEQAATYRLRSEPASDTPSLPMSPAPTGIITGAMNRITSFMLPLSVAAGLFAPNLDCVRRRVRLGASTDLQVALLHDFSSESDWMLVLEPVSQKEIDELQQIWALPYPGPPEFDFRAPAD